MFFAYCDREDTYSPKALSPERFRYSLVPDARLGAKQAGVI